MGKSIKLTHSLGNGRRGVKRAGDKVGRFRFNKRKYISVVAHYCKCCGEYYGGKVAHERTHVHKIKSYKSVHYVPPYFIDENTVECAGCGKAFSKRSRHFWKCLKKNHALVVAYNRELKKGFLEISKLKEIGRSNTLLNVYGLFFKRNGNGYLRDHTGIIRVRFINAQDGDIVRLKAAKVEWMNEDNINIIKGITSVTVFNQEGEIKHSNTNTHFSDDESIQRAALSLLSTESFPPKAPKTRFSTPVKLVEPMKQRPIKEFKGTRKSCNQPTSANPIVCKSRLRSSTCKN